MERTRLRFGPDCYSTVECCIQTHLTQILKSDVDRIGLGVNEPLIVFNGAYITELSKTFKTVFGKTQLLVWGH